MFGRFRDTDHDLLAMLASQAAVALANLRWQKLQWQTRPIAGLP